MRDTNAAAQDDTPATALGPVALGLGAFSVIGPFSAMGAFVFFPFAWMAGALAVTFGVAGIHYASQGIGRMWTATLGTVLGAAGLLGFFVLLGGIGV